MQEVTTTTSRATSACLDLGTLVDSALARYLWQVAEAQMQAALDDWELLPADLEQLCTEDYCPPLSRAPPTSSPFLDPPGSLASGSTGKGDAGRSCKARAAAVSAPAPALPSLPKQNVVEPYLGMRSWAAVVAGAKACSGQVLTVDTGQSGEEGIAGGLAASHTPSGPSTSAAATPVAPSLLLVNSWMGRAKALLSPFAAVASPPPGQPAQDTSLGTPTADTPESSGSFELL